MRQAQGWQTVAVEEQMMQYEGATLLLQPLHIKKLAHCHQIV